MLKELLEDYKVILASASPRRQSFFKTLNINFEVRLKTIEEVYPKHLQGSEISDYLAALKAEAFKDELQKQELLITSDTIVWHRNRALGKPASREEAIYMLQALSGDSHLVISSVCLTTDNHQTIFNDITEVSFKPLRLEEIHYYIDNYKPFDKAGAYGIQEWLGAIGIIHINGSYNNVVGLPTQKLYETLKAFIEDL